MSDSEEVYFESDEDMEVQEVVEPGPPAPGTTGLTLAEHYFGPLLSPIAATPAQWTAYTEHRLGTNAKYKNVFHRPKKSTSNTVVKIEHELGLDNGTLQECISILRRAIEWDDDDPRSADVLARIYSLAMPKYVDVHIKYHCRPRLCEIEWYYSIGYRIYNRISGPPTDCHKPSTTGPPPFWHCRGGWQSICWGYFDDSGNYGRNWRRIEVADMGLYEEGVIDVHEVLFGPIETPPSDDAGAVLAYRRKLVTTVCLLLAAVGVDYRVACTDEERDGPPLHYMLEGLGDQWIPRGIRAACGFQLGGDAEAERRGEEERRESALGEHDHYPEDDFSDDER